MTQPPTPQQPMQPPYAPPPPNHPQAITVLVLGIVSLVVCGPVGPFAWVMGNRVVQEIDSSQAPVGGRTEATIGRILGIVATALFALSVLVVGVFGLFALGSVVVGN